MIIPSFMEPSVFLLFLSLIPSSFFSATDLISAKLENLSNFSLSSVSHCLALYLCTSIFRLITISINVSCSLFSLASITIYLCITNSGILAFDLLIMNGGSLAFFHFLNMHPELMCLIPLIMKNVQVTVL
jgi:hypothetical protein